MKFYRPFRPWYIGQRWGVPNPAYAQFGFTQHNGLDVTPLYNPVDGAKHPIYCPVEGFKVFRVQYTPEGGGHELWLISKEKIELEGLSCYALIVFFHNDKVLIPVGYEPEIGELVSIGDSTGFSTGQHSHIGLYRVTKNGVKLDSNEANGSINPEPYIQQEDAIDQATTATLVKSGLRLWKYKMGI